MNQTNLTPDFRPLYSQVKEALLQRLRDQTFRPGDMLPSEPKLAQELGVSAGTVRKALEEMVAQNLLVRRQGKGTFVAQHTEHRALFHFYHMVDANGSRQEPESQFTSLTSGKANAAETKALGLNTHDQVIRIRRVRLLNNQPVIAEKIVLSQSVFPALSSFSYKDLPNTLYRFYEERFNVFIVRASENLRAVMAEKQDQKALLTTESQPLLEIDRLAFDINGNAVEWRVSRCTTDKICYENELE